jgi:hypothetical protein
MVITHLERPETVLADVARPELVFLPTLFAFQCFSRHLVSFNEKPLPGCGRGSVEEALVHISQALTWSLLELAPFLELSLGMVAGVS